MRELGYLEGQNVKFEDRFADGHFDRLPGLAADLARLSLDVIVAVAPGAIRAASEATRTVPIVMAFSGVDPVKAGFVASLNRPGGNVTGLTMLAPELSAKRLESKRYRVPRGWGSRVQGQPWHGRAVGGHRESRRAPRPNDACCVDGPAWRLRSGLCQAGERARRRSSYPERHGTGHGSKADRGDGDQAPAADVF
jgi:putative tryptophan/tyrosine transport system substrate-binding protein